MPPQFSRRKKTGQERSLRFIPALAAAQRLHLPECPPLASPITTVKAREWRTVRIRPEVMAIVDGLLDRSRKDLGEGELTISEIFAALILAALPQVTRQVLFSG
jgi:hypothetical protein